MSSIRLLAKRTSLSFAAALVTLFFPGLAFADSATDAAPVDTTQSTGPQQPSGVDSKTFHYNSDTGKWENDHYIWDPVTKQTTPKDPSLTYDPSTGKWSTSTWRYDAPSGGYKEVKTPAPAPSGSTDNQPQSDQGTSATSTATVDGASAVAIANGVTSTALSGDATVAYNTLGGNATSGNAAISSTNLNLLQSGIQLGGGTRPTTFVADINGNITGDLVIDPALLALLQPASNGSDWTNTDVNVENSGQIANSISLNAATGNATVDSNTAAGNATSGSANAVANVMNLANSMVTANGSFIGLVNIYGDLEGDILLPPGVLQQLLASNAANSVAASGDNNLALAATDSQNIDNNITTYAASGQATVANNTNAGSATSGKATTNVTILNLTGHQIVAADSMLVFVNVLGQWVGAIVNAPGGSTAAALGDNASNTSSNTTLTDNNNLAITNNIDVAATSGDASVTNNTNAGNATSGDASASVNLLNMTNSSLSLSGWFGIMFINVFGTWHGSFGVDTPMGDPPVATGPTETTESGNSPSTNGPSTTVALLRASSTNHSTGTSTGDENANAQANTLGVTTGSTNNQPPAKNQGSQAKNGASWKLAGVGMLIAACLLAIDRFKTIRTQHAS